MIGKYLDQVYRMSYFYLAMLALSALLLEGAPVQDQLKRSEAPKGWYLVTKVTVDPWNQLRNRYLMDDPRLLNRVVLFGPHYAEMNGRSSACTALSVSREQTNLKTYLRHSYLRPLSMYPRTPTVEQLEIPVSPLKPITLLRFTCIATKNGASHNPTWDATCAYALDARKWVLFVGDTVLTIEPLDPKAPPKASFDCSQAQTETEKAICSDPGLAGLDRSLVEAYLFASGRYTTDGLIPEQQAWLLKRDECGGDKSCLNQIMTERIEVLMTQQQWP